MKNKKIIPLILVVILSILLVVCFGGKLFKHNHRFSRENTDELYLKEKATCTSSAEYYYSCRCGQKGSKTFDYGEPLPHIYESEVVSDMYLCSAATRESPAKYYYSCNNCVRRGTKTFTYGKRLQDIWGYNYYIDYQFGETTDEWFIKTCEKVDGTFENSATNDAELLVEVLYDCNNDISIFLYEYAREDNLVKNSSSRYSDYYKIIIKNEKEKKCEVRGQMYPGGDRIYIIGRYHNAVLDLMKTSEKLKFYIEYETYPTTRYRFDLNMNNFNDMLREMQK